MAGTQAETMEAMLGYAGSIGTTLWHEIEEDRSKVRCPLGRSLFYQVANKVLDVRH
jgi:hypothetical protein